MLAFLPNDDFFLRLPFLSHRYRQLYTDPVLHRQQRAMRFSLNAEQWRLYSERSWPRRHVPVSKVAYHLTAATDESVKQEWDVSSNDDGEGVVMERQAEEDGEKDWALEATHLYQHVLFATQVLTQGMPNRTSAGRRIRWQLPNALVALLVDRLTARHVIGLVNYMNVNRQQEERIRFLPHPYYHFNYRSDNTQPLYCHLPSQTQRPSTNFEPGAPAAAAFDGHEDDLMSTFYNHADLYTILTMEGAHDLPELMPLAGHFCE